MNYKYIIFGILALIIIGILSIYFIRSTNCFTKECYICPDNSCGEKTGLLCQHYSCPPLIYCDSNTVCPDGTDCTKFPDEEKAYCYSGDLDPCFECPSRKCDILESYPIQIVCR